MVKELRVITRLSQSPVAVRLRFKAPKVSPREPNTPSVKEYALNHNTKGLGFRV